MPSAVRITDATSNGGVVIGPGASTVLINNLPAAVQGDQIASNAGVGPTLIGSTTVMICGKAALRVGDVSSKGASPLLGETSVQIG